MYYGQTDMVYSEYCLNHSDIMEGLTQIQREQFSKYMTNNALLKLRKLSAIKDGPFEFKGFKGNWNTGMRNAIIDTNCGDVKYSNLNMHFKAKALYIQSVFVSAFKDLEYIAYLIREGLAEEWLNENMPERDKVFSTDYATREFEICRQFYVLGMPIPSDLKGEYEDAKKYALEDTRLQEFYRQVDFNYEDFVNTGVKLYDLVNANIMNGDVQTNDLELALLISSFHSAVMKLEANGYSIKELHNFPRVDVYRTAGTNGLRLSTIKEIQCMPCQISLSEEILIPLASYQMLLAFCWFHTGNDMMLNLMNKFTANTMVAITSPNTRTILKVVTDYVYSADFLEELRRAEVKKSSLFYPDSAPDEIIDTPLEEKCKIILGYHKPILQKAGKQAKSKAYSYSRMIVSICDNYRRFGRLSHAQIQLVNKEVESLRKKTTDNYYTDELEQKIKQCLKVMTNYEKDRFPMNMMETVMRFKHCSVKQAKVIEDEYKLALSIMNDNYEDTSSLPETRSIQIPVETETPSTTHNEPVANSTTTAGEQSIPTQPPHGAMARPSIPSFTESKGAGDSIGSFDNYEWDDAD